MRIWLIAVATALLILGIIFGAISGGDVYSQEIISNHYIHYGGDMYVSPEINIWIRSTGSIDWSNANGSDFFLVPSYSIGKINSNNINSLSVTPIRYAGGPDTSLYEDLLGSYYVVYIGNSSPSSFSNYEFTHPPYAVDPLVGGPSSYTFFEHMFVASLISVTGALLIFAGGPINRKVRKIKAEGNSPLQLLVASVLNGSLIIFRKISGHKFASLTVAVILLFAIFTIVEGEGTPVVIPVLSTSHIYSPDIASNFTDNLTFSMNSPGVAGKYVASLDGPTPQDGGINSSQLYSFAYSLQITKIDQSTEIPMAAQTPAVANVSISIGSHVLPFRINQWDVSLIYFNGGIVSNPGGTFNTGTEYATFIGLTREISCSIPDGNYTMYVNATIQPQTVLGPYHFSGQNITIHLTYPVYVNNANVQTNPV